MRPNQRDAEEQHPVLGGEVALVLCGCSGEHLGSLRLHRFNLTAPDQRTPDTSNRECKGGGGKVVITGPYGAVTEIRSVRGVKQTLRLERNASANRYPLTRSTPASTGAPWLYISSTAPAMMAERSAFALNNRARSSPARSTLWEVDRSVFVRLVMACSSGRLCCNNFFSQLQAAGFPTDGLIELTEPCPSRSLRS